MVMHFQLGALNIPITYLTNLPLLFTNFHRHVRQQSVLSNTWLESVRPVVHHILVCHSPTIDIVESCEPVS